ncbi:MAG: hypothetical protein KJP18_11080 [Gemmatimonadetes bacterium]|nr:hypothetical protein [Gemmatimonadota bacterium]
MRTAMRTAMRPRGLRVAGVVLALVVATGACESFVPEWVETLDVQPDSVHISAGETAVFTAVPLSERGVELLDRVERVEWTLSAPGSVATLDADAGEGRVTANGLGDAVLVARLGRGVEQAPVFVQPPGLAQIRIVPDRIEIGVRERPRVRAVLLDALGNEMSPEGFRISWKFVDERIGFVGNPFGPVADLLSLRVGTTQIRLIVGGMSTSAPFIVR